jgi:hypothetical protein
MAALARGRRRALHPDGCAFRAQVDVDEGDLLSEGMLPVGRHDAVVRLSRGAGLPGWMPDILGLALKVRDDGGDLDLLLASAAPGRLGKYVLLPARRFFERPYSSILPFDNGEHRLLVGALPPAGRGPTLDELRGGGLRDASFGIAVAPPNGGWRRVGTLTFGDPLPDDESLVFEPWRLPGGARPRGFLNRLRTRAYPASQEARDEDASMPGRPRARPRIR